MLIKSILLVSSTLSSPFFVNGFGISILPVSQRLPTKSVIIFASSDKATTTTGGTESLTKDPIECFLVNQEAVIVEGEKPRVICTTDRDETAWMEGINQEDMIKTAGVGNVNGQCVEGHSVSGKPEWECEA